MAIEKQLVLIIKLWTSRNKAQLHVIWIIIYRFITQRMWWENKNKKGSSLKVKGVRCWKLHLLFSLVPRIHLYIPVTPLPLPPQHTHTHTHTHLSSAKIVTRSLVIITIVLRVLSSQVIRDMPCTSMFHLDQWTMYCRTSPDEPWKTRVFLREYSKRGVFFGESWKGGSEKENWNMTQLWCKLVLHELVLI